MGAERAAPAGLVQIAMTVQLFVQRVLHALCFFSGFGDDGFDHQAVVLGRRFAAGLLGLHEGDGLSHCEFDPVERLVGVDQGDVRILNQVLSLTAIWGQKYQTAAARASRTASSSMVFSFLPRRSLGGGG